MTTVAATAMVWYRELIWQNKSLLKEHNQKMGKWMESLCPLNRLLLEVCIFKMEMCFLLLYTNVVSVS